jgi:osmotically-inducible protein OsmY
VRVICDAIKDRNLAEVKAEFKKVLADLILRKRIEIAINAAGDIDQQLLEIEVHDGVATLGGQLHLDAERRQVVAFAEATPGIGKVVDRIKVRNYRSQPSEH